MPFDIEDNDEDIFDNLHLSHPEWDREWMECSKHLSCTYTQGTVETLYEVLSTYDRSDLSDEQNAFLDWFRKVTAL